MCDCFISNLEHIKNSNSFLYSKIASEVDRTVNLKLSVSKNNLPIPVVEYRGKDIYLHSNYDPINEAKRWIHNSLNVEESSVIFVYGFGFGYHIEELVKVVDEDKTIVVFEPFCDVLISAFKNRDFSELFSRKNFFLFLADDERLNYALDSFLPQHHDFSGKVHQYGQYRNIVDETKKEAFDRITFFHISRQVDLNTGSFYNLIWQTNGIRNLSKSVDSVSGALFYKKLSSYPAVIVGAGPSLSKNVHKLKMFSDRVVIIATPTAVPVLKKNGIRPHFITSVDPDSLNTLLFKHIDETYRDIPLVYSLNVEHHILELMKGPKIVVSTSNPYDLGLGFIFDKDVPNVDIGPSVASTAIGFARLIGSRTIIFIGLDFAYTGDKTHAEGTIYEGDQPQNDYIYVEDIYGNPIAADEPFISMKNAIENRILTDGDTYKYIDATEGGAKIKNTEILTLEAALSLHCKDEGVESTLSKVTSVSDDAKDKITRLIEFYDKGMRELLDINSLMTGAIIEVDRIINSKSDINTQRGYDMLMSYEGELTSKHIAISLMHFNNKSEIYTMINEFARKSQKQTIVLEATRKLYNVLKDNSLHLYKKCLWEKSQLSLKLANECTNHFRGLSSAESLLNEIDVQVGEKNNSDIKFCNDGRDKGRIALSYPKKIKLVEIGALEICFSKLFKGAIYVLLQNEPAYRLHLERYRHIPSLFKDRVSEQLTFGVFENSLVVDASELKLLPEKHQKQIEIPILHTKQSLSLNFSDGVLGFNNSEYNLDYLDILPREIYISLVCILKEDDDPNVNLVLDNVSIFYKKAEER